jgi:hypothetical protein
MKFANSIAVNTQQLGHVLARVRWTAGQVGEHLEPRLPATVVFTL